MEEKIVVYNGILLINKYSGMSSYDVIRRLKPKLERKNKIGHAGTLDPFAEGLLIVTLGKATKLFDKFQEMPKKYFVVGEFGYETETYDITGKRTFEDSDFTQKISVEKLETVLKNFRGEIMQIPPKFSAKKVKGQRAYNLARQKKDFDLESKKVSIYKLDLVEFNDEKFKLMVECSKGTYIRSLVVDIARAMNTFATSVALTRFGIGKYCLEDSVDLDNVVLEKDLINISDLEL